MVESTVRMARTAAEALDGQGGSAFEARFTVPAGRLITPELILSAYGAAYRYAEAKSQAERCRRELADHTEHLQCSIAEHEATMADALQELRKLGVEEGETLDRLKIGRHLGNRLSLPSAAPDDDPSGAGAAAAMERAVHSYHKGST